jgi:tetratricopeptide (TPR) repeat protein
MTKANRSILLALILIYILSFLILLGWSFFTVPHIRIGGLKTDWIIGNTLVLFARGLLPIHLSALLFGFSLFFPFKAAGEGRRFFFAQLRFAGITFLILLLPYTVLQEAALPWGLRIREDAVSKIAQADELRMKARDAASRGQPKEARRYLQYALTIFPGDEELRREIDVAGRAAQSSRQDGRTPDSPKEESGLLLNMSFDDFLARARNAFDREDYISAEYYASFALRMNQNHPVPKRIIAEARVKMAENLPGGELRGIRDFFRRKQAGADLLAGGDVIEAYRYLQALQEERPDDPDVRYYLRLAYAELQKKSFLLSEIPLTAMIPGAAPSERGVVFINKSGDTGREFLYIRKLVKTESAYYVLDIEGLGIDPEGKILYHFGAPYGKFVQDIILTHCIDDEDGGEYKAEYYKGESPNPLPFQLPTAADPEALLRISGRDSGYRGVLLWDLTQTAGAASLMGIDPQPLYMAFFARVFLPFSFFTLSFLAAAFGLRHRSRYAASPPLPYFFFLPFLPFIMILIFHTYEYGLYALQGFLLAILGFSVSLIVFCAVQGLLLFFTLLVFARQFRQ